MHTLLMPYVTDPNIVYILMLVAIYGLFFELANPGSILPGLIGMIALLFCLYAFQLLPINYTGLLLLLIGMTFMIFEVFISSFGIAGFIGIFTFILGSVMLFDSHHPEYHLSWLLVSAMSIISISFIFMVLSLAIQSHKKKIVTGKEGLIGSEGVVLNIMNEQIVVRVLGEIWAANSSYQLNRDDKIKVVAVNGLILKVEPVVVSNKN